MAINVYWYLFSLSDFNEIWNFSTDFRKYSNTKLHENPSGGSRVFAYGRTDVTKLIVAFRSFVKAPKKYCAS